VAPLTHLRELGTMDFLAKKGGTASISSFMDGMLFLVTGIFLKGA